ncbi:hypothetical protein NLM59_01265 [Weeksellaceae bacterium KMM 9724]|uniref:hypothetical protein n=1 Tax=Profundicola chukchiensis TaxID=2961959 RepID=UPI0024399BE5|nr:hypothetical protein [Profundicola chukchiensis]MDG4949541.1 hypothetical protein [Profundicola chukchiensis]
MQNLVIDNKKKEIRFQDQNKNLVNLIRFVFGLNVLNAAVFFLLFNYQDDILKWVWLVFALLNVFLLYFSFTKLSKQTTLSFSEIDSVEIKSVVGLVFKLKNGKYRKVFINRDAPIVEKLMKSFGNKM